MKNINFKKMLELKLIPKYLYDIYMSEKFVFDEFISDSLSRFEMESIQLNDFRQEFLNIELDFTGEYISLFSDKVSRDNTGSYYTPAEMATEIVKKVFSDRIFDADQSYRIADFSCGCGDFFMAIMEYLNSNRSIPFSKSVSWFYGVDIDPIALQICVVNLLLYSARNDWESIISHFKFGNPLMISDSDVHEEIKHRMFAIGRLYSKEMGLERVFFEDTFDIVVGNPPWEKIRFEERKFFRGVNKKISDISQKSVRDEEVEKLKDKWPVVYKWRKSVYEDYSLMNSKNFKHVKIFNSISGELNTYSLFTELAYNMLSKNGLLALIVKSTLVTAPVHKRLWTKFLSDKAVKGVYLFENKNRIFDIDSRERFVVFVAAKETFEKFEFNTGLLKPSMINSTMSIFLNAHDLSVINPFTNTIPNVRNNEDIAFLKEAHRQFKLFSTVHPDCHFGRLIHLTAQSEFIDKQPSEDNVPIYEGKFIERYDARYTTFRGLPESKKYANKASAVKTVVIGDGLKEIPECRYFVHKNIWNRYLAQYKEEYSLCWRSLTSSTNRRTMIAMILPTCPTCQSIQILQVSNKEELVLLLALFNSIPFDYFVRIKMPGLDLTQSVIKQIPVPSNQDYEEIIVFNGKKATLKKHILSYTLSLLKRDDRLDGLVDGLRGKVYEINNCTDLEAQKIIDLLFKEVYHLDDATYENILLTFPKYQASQNA